MIFNGRLLLNELIEILSLFPDPILESNYPFESKRKYRAFTQSRSDNWIRSQNFENEIVAVPFHRRSWLFHVMNFYKLSFLFKVVFSIIHCIISADEWLHWNVLQLTQWRIQKFNEFPWWKKVTFPFNVRME